jgi:hypothetical protein
MESFKNVGIFEYPMTDGHEGQKKIQCWISLLTWEKIEAQGYLSPTHAVNKAFELLLENSSRDLRESQENNTGSSRDNTGFSEIPELRARIEEKDILINTLQKELEKATQDKEDLKETHKNYMLQMQTLINQKAIEASGTKKPWWRFW